MTEVSYIVCGKEFTSYAQAKAEADLHGVLVKTKYTPIDTTPTADPRRLEKLAQARMKRKIQNIMQAAGI